MSHFSWRGESLLLFCHLQPGARHSGFAGIHGERLKIRIKAPPVDGKANGELLRFLAEAFAVAQSEVEITQGASSRQKTVLIHRPRHLPPEAQIAATNP